MLIRAVFILMFSVFLFACGSSSQVSTTAPIKALPEPDSMGAKLLKQYCTNCHGAPQPGVHKKNEWRNVVYRMNVRRLKRALGTIPDNEVDILVNYMEKHSQ